MAANRPAHEIFSLKDGLEFRRDFLRTALPQETSALRNSIGAGRAPVFLSLSRPSGKRPLSLLIRSLSQDRNPSSPANSTSGLIVPTTLTEAAKVRVQDADGTFSADVYADSALFRILGQIAQGARHYGSFTKEDQNHALEGLGSGLHNAAVVHLGDILRRTKDQAKALKAVEILQRIDSKKCIRAAPPRSAA